MCKNGIDCMSKSLWPRGLGPRDAAWVQPHVESRIRSECPVNGPIEAVEPGHEDVV